MQKRNRYFKTLDLAEQARVGNEEIGAWSLAGAEQRR
jgi:hypothetical protein